MAEVSPVLVLVRRRRWRKRGIRGARDGGGRQLACCCCWASCCSWCCISIICCQCLISSSRALSDICPSGPTPLPPAPALGGSTDDWLRPDAEMEVTVAPPASATAAASAAGAATASSGSGGALDGVPARAASPAAAPSSPVEAESLRTEAVCRTPSA